MKQYRPEKVKFSIYDLNPAIAIALALLVFALVIPFILKAFAAYLKWVGSL